MNEETPSFETEVTETSNPTGTPEFDRAALIAQIEAVQKQPTEEPVKAPAVAPPEDDDVGAYLKRKKLQLKEGEAFRRAQERERAAEEKIKEAERVKAQAEQETRALREAFKTNPVETFKKLNLASEEVLLALAEDGTPDKRQKTYLQSIEDKVAQFQKQLEAMEEQRQSYLKQQEAVKLRQQQDDIHARFVKMSEGEAYANVRDVWETDIEVLRAAYGVIEEYNQAWEKEQNEREASGLYREKSPEPLQEEEILLVLEERAKKKLDKLRSKYSGAKTFDKKPRTLNGVAGSERRSIQRDLSELSDEERRAALVAAAEEAMLQKA